MFQLTFPIKRQFRTTQQGITIPVSLTQNTFTVTCYAKVDPGGEYCLFQRELADDLQIDVLEGLPVKLDTLAGSLTGYTHTVELITFGLAFESVVLFTPAYGMKRNILGRRGWLNNLHMALTMDDEAIYLKSIS